MTPPLGNDGFHDTVADPFPATATTLDGIVGPAAGVTVTAGVEAVEVPTAFVAVTLMTYVDPLVRPVSKQLVVALVQVIGPGVAVTVYAVTASPFGVLAVQVTKLEASPRAAATLVGTDGNVAGTTGAELFESVVPAAFVAETMTV